MRNTQKAMVVVSYVVVALCYTLSFQPLPCFVRPRYSIRLASSIGGDDDNDGPPPPPPSGSGDQWDDFLNPNKKESENLQRAREYMSEESLPISFDDDLMETEQDVELDDDFIETTDDDDDDNVEDNTLSKIQDAQIEDPSLVALTQSDSVFSSTGASAEALATNPYMDVVSKLSPSDLISKFTSSAHPRVQNAVRTTILGLIGSLPKMAFDTTTITTGERLASLMFQLQMTGYMFKNAEYRLSLSQSLGMTSASFAKGSNLLLTGTVDKEEQELDEEVDPLRGKVRGKIKVRFGASNSTKSEKEQTESESDGEAAEEGGGGLEMEVDAAAYMSELRSEVSKLREELSLKRQATEESLRKDLLLYIRTLPQQELRQLTNTISEDVLVAMKGLVNVVLGGIGDGQIGPETVTEQSGEAMAQLCMWQLVVGYNLRELEVREEMKNTLFNGWNVSEGGGGGGVDFDQDEPGMLE